MLPQPGQEATRAIEIRGDATGLIDDPLLLRARGAGPDQPLVWRARLRDDEGRVWRATAQRADQLTARWAPVKASTGGVAALQSLRPVSIEVRVEAADGRTASRTFTRLLATEGVRVRRWRDGLDATLHRPADEQPRATVVIDATAAGSGGTAAATLAAPLLASRGVLVLTVGAPPAKTTPEEALATARERLAAVPGASAEVHVLPEKDVVVPPGIAFRDEDPAGAAARAAAWDALLARLGAEPRQAASNTGR